MRARAAAAAFLVAVTLASATATATAETRARDDHRAVVDVPVTFSVQNFDRTALGAAEQQTCPADASQRGASWTLAGHLVGSPDALHRHDRSVTLYVHGLAASGTTVFGDHAIAEAREGRASLVIDRVGYGDSTHPDGNDLCTGTEANMIHQVVAHLRAGDYGGPSFGRIVLAGHSAGGLLAEIEASTFHDVDALAVLGYEDQGFTPVVLNALGEHAARCAAPGAASYQPTFDDLRAAWFSDDADPATVTDVVNHHEPDPCGENPLPYIASNPAALAAVTVPVLLVYGESDALFDPSTAPVQASHFSNADVTTVLLPHTAHLFTRERTAPQFRAQLDRWLTGNGF